MVIFLWVIFAIWYIGIDSYLYANYAPKENNLFVWFVLSFIPGSGTYYYLKKSLGKLNEYVL